MVQQEQLLAMLQLSRIYTISENRENLVETIVRALPSIR